MLVKGLQGTDNRGTLGPRFLGTVGAKELVPCILWSQYIGNLEHGTGALGTVP